MGYGVFIHRTDSIYDDSPAERYQFPRQYLGRVRACVGDWIVYYEPRKVRETRGYYAMARVQEVIEDPTAPGMYIAIIEPGTFLHFANPVPFAPDGGVVERGVLNEHGAISGRANPRSVRCHRRTSHASWPAPSTRSSRCCRVSVNRTRPNSSPTNPSSPSSSMTSGTASAR